MDRLQDIHESALNPRQGQILRAVVENYIQSAVPVSSQTLAQASAMDLSPATIRGVMAALEEGGYLEQPHTSSGRIPTDKGLRYYIDCFLQVEPLHADLKEKIRQSIQTGTDTSSKIQNVGKTLSGLSRHVGLILAPKLKDSRLRHLEFLRLRPGQILAILVNDQGVVQNRLMVVDRDFSSSDLIRVNNYLNSLLGGVGLGEIKARILHEMAQQKDHLDQLLRRALTLSHEAVAPEVEDLFIEGEKNFLYTQEFTNLAKIREILEGLDEKQSLVELLNQAGQAPGVQIYIGGESRVSQLKECSLIVSHYGDEQRPLGTLGVIGPSRMNYSRVVPMVEFTAKLLGDILS